MARENRECDRSELPDAGCDAKRNRGLRSMDDSIGNGEAERADVIGNDAKRDVNLFLFAVSGASMFGTCFGIFSRRAFRGHRRSGGKHRSRSSKSSLKSP